MTEPEVLRLCVRVADLATPVERSIVKTCKGCGEQVWYDPWASIPILGRELIICEECLAAAQLRMAADIIDPGGSARKQ